MRLGVLMLGRGAHAAACVGVMEELERRQAQPFAVCGMHAGAWPAALVMVGYDAQGLRTALLQAARLGQRLLKPDVRAGAMLRGGRQALCSGVCLQRLLSAQAGERVLAMCERQGLFICRMARNGRPVIFSTRVYPQDEDAVVTLQASVSFAARAAMGLPPFLAPLDWMGSALIQQEDAAFACRQLALMGAQRVLIIAPQSSPRREPDALELATRGRGALREEELPEHTAVLRVILPEDIGPLSLDRLAACAQAGRQAAAAGLDGAFERMGMAFCRVLPFRRTFCGVSHRW